MRININNHDQFASRHNGPDARDEKEMLSTVNAASIEELMNQTIPASIQSKKRP